MRSMFLAAVLVLALSAPASAQDAPGSLWEPAGSAASGSVSEGGRSVLLFALALVAFAGAGGVGVLALRTPRPQRTLRRALPQRTLRRQRPQPAAAPLAALDEPRTWRPRPVTAPPPLPAFGPGSHAAPSSAPPPPES